jgi:dienelactone hydrolase
MQGARVAAALQVADLIESYGRQGGIVVQFGTRHYGGQPVIFSLGGAWAVGFFRWARAAFQKVYVFESVLEFRAGCALVAGMTSFTKGCMIACLVGLPGFPTRAVDPVAAPAHSRAEARARAYPDFPDTLRRKPLTIWSDGTRMAADLYLPSGADPEEKLPVIVFANGTGGVKRKLPTRMAPHFVAAGYAFVAFDYRGWGESDSKLMMLEPMPDPDADETVTVKARAIRWQMDAADQTYDIQQVISFVAGEPQLDPGRIGLFGTSFGGGLVTWVAAHDARVRCLVAQVPGMGGTKTDAVKQRLYGQATQQARGETEPVPYKTNRPGGKMSRYGHVRYNRAKWVHYDPIKTAHQITAPTLIIDAGADTLMDLRKNGQRLAEILAEQERTVTYHVIPDAPHYAVYKTHFAEVTKMQIAWFDRHLKAPAGN